MSLKFSENELSLEEKQNGWIVSIFNVIENIIEEIIYEFLNPVIYRENFVSNILLNNQVLNFSSKLKLIFYISENYGFELHKGKIKEALFNINSIRNSFAHNDPEYVETEFIFEENTRNISGFKSKKILKKISTKGKLEKTSRDEKVKKFEEDINFVWEPLWQMKNKFEKFNKGLDQEKLADIDKDKLLKDL